MDIHELMKEYDQTAIDNAEKILNSKEFKKLWRREVRRSENNKIKSKVKKFISENFIQLISILVAILLGILTLIIKY